VRLLSIFTVDSVTPLPGKRITGGDGRKPRPHWAFNSGNKLVYPIQGYLKNPVVKQGTLVVELVDSQLKKAVWWVIAEDILDRRSWQRSTLDSKENIENVREVSPADKKEMN
jgi:hypothetical protein